MGFIRNELVEEKDTSERGIRNTIVLLPSAMILGVCVGGGVKVRLCIRYMQTDCACLRSGTKGHLVIKTCEQHVKKLCTGIRWAASHAAALKGIKVVLCRLGRRADNV